MRIDSEVRGQVYDQYRLVQHLAETLATVHKEAISVIPRAPDGVIEIMGKRSAHLIEVLGDILNDMDAVDENSWGDLIFEKAQSMFPASAQSLPVEAPEFLKGSEDQDGK